MRQDVYVSLFICISGITCGQDSLDTLGNSSLKNEDSSNLKIIRLNINSANSDFSPYVLNSQLMFVSGRSKNGAVKYVDNANGSEITDIYTSQRTDSIKYKSVTLFETPINSKYYEGPFCFNKEGSIIYFTKNDQNGLLKLYRSEKVSDKWTKPQMLSFCLPEYSYCHPAISPNDSRLIFSSNMNPKNKMDLYVSEQNNGSWTDPKALSSKINDTANQVFPFISANNVLYFSSRKQSSLGGLDIYFIDLNFDTSLVRTLPSPINSPSDDFGVWIDPVSKTGYFSSDRNSRYKDDIYYFGNKMPEFSKWMKPIPKNKFCYTFFEERLIAYADTLKTIFEWDFGDGKKAKGLKTRHCYDGPGEYLVKLNTIDNISGEIFTNETSAKLAIEKPDKLTIESKESITEGQDLLLRTDNCYVKGCVLDKMYWSFGDGRYNSGSVVKHRYSVPGNYNIQVGLIARDTVSNKLQHYKIEKNITVMKRKN